MKRRAGLTLLELLVAAIVVGVLTTALARAFSITVSYPALAQESRQREEARTRFEDRIRSLLENATVNADTTDTNTYFLAGSDAAGDQDRVTFTTALPVIPGALAASEDDFETQNQRFGPSGGLEEVSIGTTPVGQTNQSTGVFLREQRPADGDTTQGGYETLLDANVTQLQWEFFDGTTWQTEWNTANTGRRFPSAVRLTYQLDGEDQPRIMVVRLQKSDATPDNPATEVSTTGGTTA